MEGHELVVNYWSILVSAVLYFILGAFWYSPKLFGNAWLELVDVDMSNKKGLAQKYLIAFGCILVATFVLAHFMEYATYFTGVGGFMGGIQTAFWCWLGFSGAQYLINLQFEDRPWNLFLINSGYHLAGLMLGGIIIGLWR